MSIQTEISRISTNVSNALLAIAAKGVAVPANANSDNLVELINAIGAVSVTNLVDFAEAIDSTAIYNGGLGYKNGYRLSSSSPFESANSAYVMTGFIPFDPTNSEDIYIKGAAWVDGDSNCRWYLFKDKSTLSTIVMQGSQSGNQNDIETNFTIETLGDNYIKLTHITRSGGTSLQYYGAGSCTYFRMSLKGTGENLVISIGEPIE